MAHAFYKLGNQGCKHTHAKHVTRTAFPWQQRLRERASTLRLHVQRLSSVTGDMEKKKICTRILVVVNSGLLKQYCSRRTFTHTHTHTQTHVHSASENGPESRQQTWSKTGFIYSQQRRPLSQPSRPQSVKQWQCSVQKQHTTCT